MMLSCGMMIVANLIEYAGMVAGAVFSPTIPFNAVLIYLPINGLNVVMYAYFYQICSFWASMYSGNMLISGPGPSGRAGASLGSNNNRDHIPNQGASSSFQNPKKKAKTLAELAKEQEEANKNKPSDLA